MCVCVFVFARMGPNGYMTILLMSFSIFQVLAGYDRLPPHRPGPGPSERRGRAAGVQENPGWELLATWYGDGSKPMKLPYDWGNRHPLTNYLKVPKTSTRVLTQKHMSNVSHDFRCVFFKDEHDQPSLAVILYPLVNIQKTMVNQLQMAIFNSKLLNYQRAIFFRWAISWHHGMLKLHILFETEDHVGGRSWWRWQNGPGGPVFAALSAAVYPAGVRWFQ